MPPKIKADARGILNTLSKSKLTKLRLKIHKPNYRTIEIIDSAKQKRVCSLKIGDFRSRKEAELFAELFRLAPELLQVNNAKTDRLHLAFQRITSRMKSIKAAQKKIESRFAKQKQTLKIRNEC